jgi:hypothetical protein
MNEQIEGAYPQLFNLLILVLVISLGAALLGRRCINDPHLGLLPEHLYLNKRSLLLYLGQIGCRSEA